MRANDFLIESKGLFGRRIGDPFSDKNGNIINFQGIDIYPSDKGNDAFPDEKSMINTYKQVSKNKDPQEVNQRNPRARSFAIAHFALNDGSQYHWVKWFIKVPTNLLSSAWKNDEVPNDGNGWELALSSSKKSKTGLSPKELIQTDKEAFSTVPSIVDKIAPGISEELRQGVGQIASGKLPATFVGQKDKFEAIRDNLGEVIQPIALMSGVVGGDAEKAAAEVLKAPYSKCKVVWPQSKTTRLIDSYFIAPTGETLGISSKGGNGAAASIDNIFAAIKKAKLNSPELVKKYNYAVSLIQILAENDSKQGPIQLGLKLKIISPELVDEINTYIRVPTKNSKKLSREAKLLVEDYIADVTNPGYNVGSHLVSAVAKKICQTVNNENRFSAACIAFLNQSSIIQVYTDAKVSGNDVQITGFRSVYPPNYSGKVLMTTKLYGATTIKGKITFKIP